MSNMLYVNSSFAARRHCWYFSINKLNLQCNELTWSSSQAWAISLQL